MEFLIKFCRDMGWLWCWPQKRLQDGYDLEHFLIQRLPIFWIMGPPGCGKSTIARHLAEASDYRLVKISDLIKDEVAKNEWRGKVIAEFTRGNKSCPNEIVLNLLKELFYTTCDEANGYILDGFPIDLTQGKQFEFEICKVFIIIYPTLTLDVFVKRYLRNGGSRDDIDNIKETHMQDSQICQEIYRRYEQKTLKCITIYKIERLLNALICDLDRYFGYKFNFLPKSVFYKDK